MHSHPYVKQFDTPTAATVVAPRGRMKQFLQHARDVREREQLRLRAEILRIPGLMTLLMKPRNGERWTQDDRNLLQAQLRGLGVVTLYLATLAIPGTTLTLPLLAWWLDRRRFRLNPLSEDNLNKAPTPPSR